MLLFTANSEVWRPSPLPAIQWRCFCLCRRYATVHIFRSVATLYLITAAFQDETRAKAVQAGAGSSLVAIMESCQHAIFQVRSHTMNCRPNQRITTGDAALCAVSSHEGASLCNHVAYLPGTEDCTISIFFNRCLQ